MEKSEEGEKQGAVERVQAWRVGSQSPGEGELLGKGVFSLALATRRHAEATGFREMLSHQAWAQVWWASGLTQGCDRAGWHGQGSGIRVQRPPVRSSSGIQGSQRGGHACAQGSEPAEGLLTHCWLSPRCSLACYSCQAKSSRNTRNISSSFQTEPLRSSKCSCRCAEFLRPRNTSTLEGLVSVMPTWLSVKLNWENNTQHVHFPSKNI